MITPYSFGGVLLNTADYQTDSRGIFDGDKDIVLNDMLGDGQMFGRSKHKEKNIVLDITVTNYDLKKIVALNAFKQGNTTKLLVVDTEAFGRLQIWAEVSSFAWSDSSALSISVKLTAPDPCLYSNTATVVTLGAGTGNGIIFSKNGITFSTSGFLFGQKINGGTTITNLGNVDAYPIFTITGPCSEIVVENKTTEETINIDAILGDSDTLVIDCSAGPNNTRGVYLNGNMALSLKTNTGWVHCAPGDNIIAFSRNSTILTADCTVNLQSRWL